MSAVKDINLNDFGLNVSEAKKEMVINEKTPISAFDVFRCLPLSAFTKLVQKAVNIGAGALKDAIKDKVKRAMPAASQKSAKSKYDDTLLSAVRIGRWREEGENADIRSVHILGSRRQGSGTYRLRFYEEGGERGDKDTPTWRGEISGYHFFEHATREVNPQQIIMEKLTKALKQINGEAA